MTDTEYAVRDAVDALVDAITADVVAHVTAQLAANPAVERATGTSDPDELLSPGQAAGEAPFGEYTLRERLRSGVLHGHRTGNRWSITRASLQAWVAGLDPGAQRRVCPLCARLGSPAADGR
jgi:hypothetical protein